ncbi:MAG: Bifunctional adenosylcobalamin biosynthesis protein CobP [Lentisphaerae bacterium ADurb.Bin242]|nr:MAG: Bifunctional adenosylcobalamin biosynthesis protein CobP [Lentisphaerae bacterium ADurb.Bin242]
MNRNRIVLVTGGARSGKSSFSEKRVLASGTKYVYIATAPVLDEEMKKRVGRHQARRAGDGWITIEEPLDLCRALSEAERLGADAALVDCLTLWINNRMYRDPEFDEAKMAIETEKLLEALKAFPGLAMLVINEVGLGIVPDTPLGRAFRDCSGRCGQLIAAEADEVWFCICGIPQKIKG